MLLFDGIWGMPTDFEMTHIQFAALFDLHLSGYPELCSESFCYDTRLMTFYNKANNSNVWPRTSTMWEFSGTMESLLGELVTSFECVCLVEEGW